MDLKRNDDYHETNTDMDACSYTCVVGHYCTVIYHTNGVSDAKLLQYCMPYIHALFNSIIASVYFNVDNNRLSTNDSTKSGRGWGMTISRLCTNRQECNLYFKLQSRENYCFWKEYIAPIITITGINHKSKRYRRITKISATAIT